MKLTRRVALVSGAGGGIGRAICLAFAEAEAAIACCDIDAASAEETARLARNVGGRAIAQPCDVSVQAQTEAAAAAAHRAFGRVDILVSGAAPHDPSGTVLETSLADWDRVLPVNLTGAFLLSRAALPYMITLDKTFGSTRFPQEGWSRREHCSVTAASRRVGKTLARSICWAASAGRQRLLRRHSFSPATRRALLPAAICSSTAVTPRFDQPRRKADRNSPANQASTISTRAPSRPKQAAINLPPWPAPPSTVTANSRSTTPRWSWSTPLTMRRKPANGSLSSRISSRPHQKASRCSESGRDGSMAAWTKRRP
jgi:NAD(P)-dependent dehydrogenase (short-subunit alcohol dehydrogenase family)